MSSAHFLINPYRFWVTGFVSGSQATKTLKASQAMYRSWNERYRRQREMILRVVKSADPEIRRKVEAIYHANSKAKLDKLQESLFDD